jgi:glutamine synthetase type III
MTPQKPARLLKNFKSSTRSISTSSSFIFDDSQSQVQHLFPHLVDATEEISALIRESRFTDATETILKAKTELVESMNQVCTQTLDVLVQFERCLFATPLTLIVSFFD